ncbi:hypothetical protein Pmani_016750 [Petrolisthes manimaculis]|uniref:Type-1 angiotensin II receptor-associated protein n=1 Tax=Petrolisthes manimaculis TaxID=1843537 RepID=A0AAE1UAP4_9EUCA|nr:hypothetical protein Pmani_016750 [Petrolisthes manimaculis]
MPSTSLTLRGIFLAHLILTVWSNFSGCLTVTFTYYNSAFLFLVLWSLLHRECDEAPFLGLALNLSCIMFDVMTLALAWPTDLTGVNRFGVAMAFVNLLLRPVTSYFLYRVWQDRAGSYGNFGLPSGFDRILGGPRRSPYEDIDQQPQTNTQTGGEPENTSTPLPSEPLFTT